MAIFHFHSIVHTQGDFSFTSAVLHTAFGASLLMWTKILASFVHSELLLKSSVW